MTVLASTAVTLADWAKRIDPSGNVDTVIEALSQSNEILDDMLWVEGNLPTGHRTTIRTGLPTAAWRLLNYGVAQSKSTTVQVDDTVGMLEAYSELDRDLLALNGNSAAFRLSEDVAFTESMKQTFNSTLFYGNTATDPEKFLGLGARFNDIGSGAPQNKDNILDGSGTGSDNTSIWLIGWGQQSVHGIFPKGSQAGLQMRDLGEDTKVDANGLMHQVFRTHFQWKCGLSVRDWRYVVRIANIDSSELTKNASAGADLIDLMVQALEKIKDLNGVKPAFYVNRTISSFLRRQMTNKATVYLNLDEVAGKKVMTFGEVPVRRCDSLTNAEATIS
jgi:hypothetical protein